MENPNPGLTGERERLKEFELKSSKLSSVAHKEPGWFCCLRHMCFCTHVFQCAQDLPTSSGSSAFSPTPRRCGDWIFLSSMKNLYLCIHVHSPKLGKVYVLCWFLVHNFVNRDEWVQEPAYWRDTALGELSLLSFWVFLLKMMALTETLATMTLLRKKKKW